MSEREGSRVDCLASGAIPPARSGSDDGQGRRGRHSRVAEAEWGITMMRNTREIDGFRAIIQYDPEMDMFRGEFVGLNGGADFYANDIAGLRKEGALSLKIFLEMCREDGVESRKKFSGKFNVRLPPELHATIAKAAAAQGKSINQWVTDELTLTASLAD